MMDVVPKAGLCVKAHSKLPSISSILQATVSTLHIARRPNYPFREANLDCEPRGYMGMDVDDITPPENKIGWMSCQQPFLLHLDQSDRSVIPWIAEINVGLTQFPALCLESHVRSVNRGLAEFKVSEVAKIPSSFLQSEGKTSASSDG